MARSPICGDEIVVLNRQIKIAYENDHQQPAPHVECQVSVDRLFSYELDDPAVEQGFIETAQDHRSCEREADGQPEHRVQCHDDDRTDGAEEGWHIALDAGEVCDEEAARNMDFPASGNREAEDNGGKEEARQRL